MKDSDELSRLPSQKPDSGSSGVAAPKDDAAALDKVNSVGSLPQLGSFQVESAPQGNRQIQNSNQKQAESLVSFDPKLFQIELGHRQAAENSLSSKLSHRQLSTKLEEFSVEKPSVTQTAKKEKQKLTNLDNLHIEVNGFDETG